jgi:hypothetical protein
MTDVVEELTPHTARERLVERLTAKGVIARPEVAAAFRAVPRHEFAPAGTSLQAAYADDVVVTKKDADGRATSSISAPWLSLSTPIVLPVSQRQPRHPRSAGSAASSALGRVGQTTGICTVPVRPRGRRVRPAAGGIRRR